MDSEYNGLTLSVLLLRKHIMCRFQHIMCRQLSQCNTDSINKDEENDNDRGTEKINDNFFTSC